ncbi:MAG: hypothetical protein WC303_03665 [Candidatus Paceibacterota bacterium]|jgi:hypothetical protein
MFEFIKKYINHQKKKQEYNEVVRDFVKNGKLTNEQKKELNKFVENNSLKKEDVLNIHKKACELAWDSLIGNKIITEEEKNSLEDIMNYFGLTKDDFNFNQKAFNKYYTLGLIDKGELPKIEGHDVEVIFKKNEVLHWGCPANIKKYKRITNRVSYGGPTASIRIMKGVRYRVGSLGYSTSSSEYLVSEDTGIFWLTNQRIGFKGDRKNFVFPYSKIYSFSLSKDGLSIVKDGREKPYILGLDDYDVPCAIISYIINQ